MHVSEEGEGQQAGRHGFRLGQGHTKRFVSVRGELMDRRVVHAALDAGIREGAARFVAKLF